MPYKDKEREAAFHREYYKRNKIKLDKQSKDWCIRNRVKRNRRVASARFKLRLEVLIHYSNNILKCACCEEDYIEFLTIDHINGREKGDCRSGNILYRYLKKEGFPRGYQVLCWNCNLAKGIYGECPHVREKKI